MFRYVLILIGLASVFNLFVPKTFAYERVVLLAPAAGDIFIKLHAQGTVVGVTRSNDDFPNALKIGSHIKPNVELLKGLNPDLLVISSNRFFSDQLAIQTDADVIRYDPTDLEGILQAIHQFGHLLNRKKQAAALIRDLEQMKRQIKPLAQQPRVVFEVTENPLMIAGERSIVNGIVTAAGGKLLAPEKRKIARFNVESLVFEHPDYYLYQVGPMNQHPTPPADRPNYRLLHSIVIQVDQRAFSRATTQSFSLALELNKRFQQRVLRGK